MKEIKDEVKKEVEEVKDEKKETPGVEKAECCANCMSFNAGRLDSGICTRHRTDGGMMETKDTNYCSEFMSKEEA